MTSRKAILRVRVNRITTKQMFFTIFDIDYQVARISIVDLQKISTFY